jgi:parallel beta-helix repeat protein
MEGIDILTEDVGQLIMFRVRNISISEITISKVPAGIQIIESDNVTLQTIDISETYVGIEVNSVTNSTFIDCDISDLGGGMYIHRSDFNEFIDNNFIFTAMNELGGSLSLYYSDHNTIRGNTFFSSKENKTGYGIKSTWSSDNLIYNNNFFYTQNTTDNYTKDTFQAFDFISNNFWNSNSGIGNYWRDWRIPDNDSNGIVDIPYGIGASGAVMPQDHYPLTTCPVVAPPTNVTIETYEDSIYLDWDEPVQTNYTKILRYNIYRQTIGPDPLEPPSIHGTIVGSMRFFIDTFIMHNVSEYRYYITAMNQLIESDPSEIVTGSPKITPPVVNITSPANNSYINTNEVTVEWEVFDEENWISDTKIRIDNEPWIDIHQGINHTFSDLTEGPHFVEITVLDKVSLIDTDNVSFYIDLTNPVINITSPAEGALITRRIVTVAWEAMDLGSGIERYEVRPDCCNWTEADWNTGHTFAFEEDGIHGIEVAAIDRAGNRIEAGITFTVDSFLPELTILTPQDGLMSQDGTIRVTWEGGDNGTGIEGYWFRVNDWNWTFVGEKKDKTLWNLYDGEYSIQVKVADLAGNIRIEEVIITVDGTLPNLRILGPDDGSIISVSPVSIKWNGTDATSGIDRFEIRLGDNQWVDVGLDQSYTIVNLKEGHYKFSIRAYDKAGNSVLLTTSFTLDQTRPEAVTFSPVGNEVDPYEVISVTFTERMHQPTMQFRVEDVKGSLEWKGDRVMFIPERNLTYGKTYNITVLGWDLAGNRMESLIWSFRTTSKGTVQGYIVDKNGDPIQFAWIYVENENQTRSREDGFFTIDIESGKTTLIVEADGYRTVEVPLELEPGEVQIIDRLVMSKESKRGFSTWACLLWALLVFISLAVVVGAAVYINSRRRMTDEE